MTDKIKEELEKEIKIAIDNFNEMDSCEQCPKKTIDKQTEYITSLHTKLSQHLATKQAMIKEFEKIIDERIKHSKAEELKQTKLDNQFSIHSYIQRRLELEELKQKLGELKT